MRSTLVLAWPLLMCLGIGACADPSFVVTPAPSPLSVAPDNPAPQPPAAPPTARYEVVFTSTWSAASHPTDFPNDAHYSGLIGGTHRSSVSFWAEGALASEGIRRMAERGAKSPLDSEVAMATATGHAQHLLSGGALATSPGSVSLTFDITREFPLVTLVTMVAPSPDWFVGVSGLALLNGTEWVDEIAVDLVPFDAGTDSGATYRAADVETLPRVPISRLVGYPVSSGNSVLPFGRFVFRRLP